MTNKNNSEPTIYPMPLVRVDLAVFSIQEGCLKVLLSQRKEAPFKNKWGLPGGVLRIDLDESFPAAAKRIGMERIGIAPTGLQQVVTAGGAKRDPRAPWAVSVVFRGMLKPDLQLSLGKRISALEWQPVANAIASGDLAFDHSDLIKLAVNDIQSKVRELNFPEGTLQDTFTIPELQALSEEILGHTLDKVTFRRRVLAKEMLTEIPEELRGGAHRPAKLYRLTPNSD